MSTVHEIADLMEIRGDNPFNGRKKDRFLDKSQSLRSFGCVYRDWYRYHCFCETTAGYQNLSGDFNMFLVRDASLATFFSNHSSRFAVNVAISFTVLNHLVTQVSWVKSDQEEQ